MSEETKSEVCEYTFDNITEKITSLNSDELVDATRQILEGWIINILDEYHPHYVTFQENWENMCKSMNVSSKKILIVSEIPLNREEQCSYDFDLLHILCGELYKRGFHVRRSNELIQFKDTNLCILTKELHANLYENNAVYKRILDEKWPGESL
jgi:hypothetical protein